MTKIYEGRLTESQMKTIVNCMEHYQAIMRVMTGSALPTSTPFGSVYVALECFTEVEQENKTDGS